MEQNIKEFSSEDLRLVLLKQSNLKLQEIIKACSHSENLEVCAKLSISKHLKRINKVESLYENLELEHLTRHLGSSFERYKLNSFNYGVSSEILYYEMTAPN